MSWFLKVVKNYAGFSGRAQRAEYWYFNLFMLIFLVLAAVIDGALGMGIEGLGYGPFYCILSLGLTVPALAVLVRRLHDIGKSGWWYWIALIPLAGAIWLLVLLCKDSDAGDNLYGPNPKGL